MRQESTSKEGKRPFKLGKYEVIAHIATGGMGAVYKALDTDLKRTVALKILSPEMAGKPNMVERFKREGRSAAKLRHENVVAIYECGEYNGTHFLALEFVDGKDLQAYIARHGQLDVEEARQILVQAAKALDHAHRNHIIHRDIKPSNFLITKTEGGQLLVKLTDLGLARQMDDEACRVTKPESTIGTVDYMSPEQAQNSGSADIRSDIYSLGCTYFHMLAGKCPFPTGSMVSRILKHREAEPPDIRTLNANVPDSIYHILGKMLAKKPKDRFQTPRDLLDALENAGDFSLSMEQTIPKPLLKNPTSAGKPPSNPRVKVPKSDPAEVPSTDESSPQDQTEEYVRPAKPVIAKKNVRASKFSPSPKKSEKSNLTLICFPWPLGPPFACCRFSFGLFLVNDGPRKRIRIHKIHRRLLPRTMALMAKESKYRISNQPKRPWARKNLPCLA